MSSMYRPLLTAIVALVAAAVTVEASPVGPVRPRPSRWSLGLDAGFQLKRDFELETNPADDWETDERFAYLGRVSYGLSENWEVFGRLGAATLKVQDVPGRGETGTANLNYFDMGTEFTWGIGLSGIAIPDFLPNFDLAVSAQYLQHGSHDGAVTSGANINTIAENWDYSEWEAALLFQTSQYETYLLYAGPVLGNARVSRGSVGTTEVADLETDQNVGVVVGVGFEFIEDGLAFVEGRLVDETALNVGVLWAF